MDTDEPTTEGSWHTVPNPRSTGLAARLSDTLVTALQQGASFKEIGDLLGHRSLESVGIYAKVDLRALRSVAAVGLGGLA